MADTRPRLSYRCRWCGVRMGLWRALTRRHYCPTCGPRLTGSAGIYLQSGGPPFRCMGRAEDHHAPRTLLHPATDVPPRAPWWIRLLCQHCWHLSTVTGSWCCECAKIARYGLPISPCVPCDEGGHRR